MAQQSSYYYSGTTKSPATIGASGRPQGTDKFTGAYGTGALNDSRSPKPFYLDNKNILPWMMDIGAGGQITPFGRALQAGVGNLGQLLANPGMMSSGIATSIAPQLSMMSELIARNTQGQQLEAAGAGARSGLQSSNFQQALQRAIGMQGAGQMADSRRELMLQGEQLKRQDMDQLMEIMRFLTGSALQYKGVKAGVNATQGQEDAMKRQERQQKTAATMATIASIAAAFASDVNLKHDFADVDGAEVLEKIRSMPVSEWSYVWEDGTRHIGPMAQDFFQSFGLGDDDKKINFLDAIGVLFAGLKALADEVEEIRG